MKKVLITGASGFLGNKLFDMYKARGDFEVLGTYNTKPSEGMAQLDVTDRESVRQLIRNFRPDTVIHTVALSDPDVCEQRQEDANAINVEGTKNIVEACDEIGADIDYVSTVYVFDGEKGNYGENDTPNPINHYGRTKLAAEKLVQRRKNGKSRWWRFDKLYGFNGEGKVNDVFSKFDKGQPFEVNNDQVRQPLFIDDIGKAMMNAQERGLTGPFHLAGEDKMTKKELTDSLARLVGKEPLVVGIPEKEQIARRPKDASIVGSRMDELGIKCTPFKEALTSIRSSITNYNPEGYRRSVEG